jgi:hypothetical protein
MPIVAVESTLNWCWLVDGLQEAGLEVKLGHPLGLFMITGAKETPISRIPSLKLLPWR